MSLIRSMTLSVVLATFNEEKRLRKCLESIKTIASEIVIVDGRSIDRTVEIAKMFDAKVKVVNNEYIFHINKQKAVDLASSDWILQLDADEVVSPVLQDEIKIATKSKKYNGYYIPRKNFFLGHWMRKGGQYPDPVIRLFKKDKGRFPQKSVHEQIVIEGAVGILKNELLHYPYQSFSEYWGKAIRYSHLVAREMERDHVPKNIFTVFNYFFIKPVFIFLNLFVFHRGFVDGIFGFLFAYFSGMQLQMALLKYFYGKNLN